MQIINKSDFQLLLAINTQLKKDLIDEVTKQLQDLGRDFMTGPEDSGLMNVWEEICVQVQDEESIHWYVYQETMERYMMDAFHEMAEPIQQVIARIASLRLNDDECLELNEWYYDEDSIKAELIEDLILEAKYFSNARIDAYLNGNHDIDDDL